MSGLDMLLLSARAMSEVPKSPEYSEFRAGYDVTGGDRFTKREPATNKDKIIRTIAKVYSATCQDFILTNPDMSKSVIDRLLKKPEIQNLVRTGNTVTLPSMHLLEECLKWTATYVAYGYKMLISPCVVLKEEDVRPFGGNNSCIWNSFINQDMQFFEETIIPGTQIMQVGKDYWKVEMKRVGGE